MGRPRFEKAIVVGASSGIGEQIAWKLAESGCRVAAVARRQDRLEALAARAPERIRAYAHDVRNIDEAPELFQRITGDLGGLDLVVYAAGVMPAVGPEEFDTEKDRDMVETNLLGAIAWLNQAALRFQGTRSGTIVGIGSLAGERGRRGQPVYNASKAGLHAYLEALRNRLDRLGVAVVTIKPGPVATEMTAHLELKNAMSAESAATLVLQKARASGEYCLKPMHRALFWAIRHVPSWIFRRLPIS